MPGYSSNMFWNHMQAFSKLTSVCPLQMEVSRRSCKHRTVEGVVAVCDGYGTESTVPFNIDAGTVYMALRNFQLKVRLFVFKS